MAKKNCRDCEGVIDWAQTDAGKWYPIDPGTGRAHRCALKQKCEDCGAEFEGANWMRVCGDCYRGKGAAPAEPKAPPREREPLKAGLQDDENPF